MRDASLKRYLDLSSNPLPIQEEVSWRDTPATKWTFPEGTIVVGFPQTDGFVLVNMVVPRKLQKKGVGSRILEWFNARYNNNIQVQQVQDSAIGFWDRALKRGLICKYTQG